MTTILHHTCRHWKHRIENIDDFLPPIYLKFTTWTYEQREVNTGECRKKEHTFIMEIQGLIKQPKKKKEAMGHPTWIFKNVLRDFNILS